MPSAVCTTDPLYHGYVIMLIAEVRLYCTLWPLHNHPSSHDYEYSEPMDIIIIVHVTSRCELPRSCVSVSVKFSYCGQNIVYVDSVQHLYVVKYFAFQPTKLH